MRITVNRRPVAELRPLPERPHWVTGAAVGELLAVPAADPGLLEDLRPLRDRVIEQR